jgi:hypothetical protein
MKQKIADEIINELKSLNASYIYHKSNCIIIDNITEIGDTLTVNGKPLKCIGKYEKERRCGTAIIKYSDRFKVGYWYQDMSKFRCHIEMHKHITYKE